MSQSELEAYCDKKGGKFLADRDGAGSNCTIGAGKNQVVIACSSSGNCTISHTMVFSSKPSTHGPVGQAPDTTLGKSGKNSAGASTSGASTLAGGDTSSNGVATTKQAPLAGASNTNTSGTAGGGGLASNRSFTPSTAVVCTTPETEPQRGHSRCGLIAQRRVPRTLSYARVKPGNDDLNRTRCLSTVMPGFVPGIHDFLCARRGWPGQARQ